MVVVSWDKISQQYVGRHSAVKWVLTTDEDISHGLGTSVAAVPAMPGNVTTRIPVVGISSRPEPDPRISRSTVVLVVAYDADPGLGAASPVCNDVESLPVASPLQGWTRHQALPAVTADSRRSVIPVSNERMKRRGLLVDWQELHFSADFHSKADASKGRVPVGGQFGFLSVEPSLASFFVISVLVCPVIWVVTKGVLRKNNNQEKEKNRKNEK